jgi:EmrB/QacA subfamily drug resistance transporter
VADAGSATVALPTIAGHFDTDLPTTQWIIVGYALTISALLVPMGRLSDILGRKRIYVAGFALFAIGALLAGFSSGITVLILSRILMGIGAAMSQGPSMAIMVSAFPEEERGKALGLQMSAVGTGAVAGPALGGVIISAFGWRWIFFSVSILGVITVITATLILQPDLREKGQSRPPFDLRGASFSAGFLILFLLGLSNGPRIGWTSPYTIVSFAGALTLLALFVWWELRAGVPMLDLRYFKHPIFSIGVISRFVIFLGMTSVFYLMPFYFQSILGFSAKFFGLISIPGSICMIIVSPLAGRLSDRFGRKKFIVGGLLVSAASLLLLSSISVESPLLFVVPVWVLQWIGNGLFGASNNASVLSVVPRERFGVIASFLNMIRNAGTVTGTALATVVITSVMVSRGLAPTLETSADSADPVLAHAFLTGMRISFLGSAVLLTASILLYLMVRRKTKPLPGRGT